MREFLAQLVAEGKKELVNLLTSKKFLASVGTAVFAVVSRTRFHGMIDEGTVDRVIAVMATYVVGQAAADYGAQKGATTPPASPTPAPAPTAP